VGEPTVHSFNQRKALVDLVPAISTDKSTLLSPKSGSNLERVEAIIKRTLGCWVRFS